MWETNDVHEFQEGQKIIVFNLSCMAHKHQSKFLQMYQTATKNGIDGVEFVKTWNHYAQDIYEHVFWEVKEPHKTFTKRGE